MSAYPPNSMKAAGAAQKPKVEQVTSAKATRRKKSLLKQFKSTFIGGDAKTAVHFATFTVILPMVKDMLVEAGAQGLERLVYGEARRGRRPPGTNMGYGHVAYNRMGAQQPRPQRSISQRARQAHDFDEILLESRVEAVDVLDQMVEIVSKFDVVTVADLYSLTGLTGTHVDNKWGWTDLRGASVRRVRSDGYLLDLPEPEFLDD